MGAMSSNSSLQAGGGGGGGGAVTVADGADVTQGAQADAAVTNPATTASVVAILKGLLTLLDLGQENMANSIGVVIASDQSAVPISAASLPLPSGASTAAKQPALGTAGTPSTDVISVQGVVSGTAQPVSGTVTANIGTTNGLGLDATLQSILTDVAKLIAPSVNAGNRDATTQRIIEAGNPTPTVTQVASSATDVSILAANANKKGTLFFNDSTQILYLLYGTGTASTTNYSVQIGPKAYFEDPLHYTGGFHGIWASANGFVYATEVS